MHRSDRFRFNLTPDSGKEAMYKCLWARTKYICLDLASSCSRCSTAARRDWFRDPMPCETNTFSTWWIPSQFWSSSGDKAYRRRTPIRIKKGLARVQQLQIDADRRRGKTKHICFVLRIIYLRICHETTTQSRSTFLFLGGHYVLHMLHMMTSLNCGGGHAFACLFLGFVLINH